MAETSDTPPTAVIQQVGVNHGSVGSTIFKIALLTVGLGGLLDLDKRKNDALNDRIVVSSASVPSSFASRGMTGPTLGEKIADRIRSISVTPGAGYTRMVTFETAPGPEVRFLGGAAWDTVVQQVRRSVGRSDLSVRGEVVAASPDQRLVRMTLRLAGNRWDEVIESPDFDSHDFNSLIGWASETVVRKASPEAYVRYGLLSRNRAAVLAEIHQAIAEGQNRHHWITLQARLLIDDNRVQEGIHLLEDASSTGGPQSQIELSRHYRRVGNHGDSVRWSDQGVKSDPTSWQAHLERALALTGSGRHEDADLHFVLAIVLSPRAEETYRLYAESLRARGLVQLAGAVYEGAARTSDRWKWASDGAADMRISLRKNREAAAARRLDANTVLTHVAMGDFWPLFEHFQSRRPQVDASHTSQPTGK